MADPRRFGDGRSDFSKLFEDPAHAQRSQKVNAKVLRRAPTIRDLGEGEHCYSVVGGVYKMHVRIDGSVKSVTLT